MRFFFLKPARAFTLIETLIAISILLIAVAGPMVVVSQALTSSYYARDQITAFYLAQDAMEYLRNVKDVNIKKSLVAFPSPDYDLCANPQGCTIDTLSGRIGTNRQILNYFSNTGSYGYDGSGGDPSRFSRIVLIKQSSVVGQNSVQMDEYKIDVTVSWKPTALGGANRSITLTEYLYNVTNF